MGKNKTRYILICLAIIVVSIVADQVTKVYFENALQGGKTINVLGEWLTFSWTINYGSSFGSMQGRSILFFIITLLGLPTFGYFLWRARTRSLWGQLGFTFMFGGTIGNAIDRAMLGDGFFNGGVRDFISVDGFAIFNVADSFLVVGVIMVIIAVIFADYDALVKPENNNKDNANG